MCMGMETTAAPVATTTQTTTQAATGAGGGAAAAVATPPAPPSSATTFAGNDAIQASLTSLIDALRGLQGAAVGGGIPTQATPPTKATSTSDTVALPPAPAAPAARETRYATVYGEVLKATDTNVIMQLTDGSFLDLAVDEDDRSLVKAKDLQNTRTGDKAQQVAIPVAFMSNGVNYAVGHWMDAAEFEGTNNNG